MSELLRQNNLHPYRKFIETFSNGIIVYSLFLFPAPRPTIDHFLSHFSLLYLIPKSELTPSFMRGEMSIEEYTYCSSATRFVYYFINQRSEEFIALSRGLASDPISLGRLRMLYTSMKRGSVSLNRILDVVKSYPTIVQQLVKDFVARTSSKSEGPPEENVQLIRLIDQLTSSNPMDSQIMTALAHFNRSVRYSSASLILSTPFLSGCGCVHVLLCVCMCGRVVCVVCGCVLYGDSHRRAVFSFK